MKFLCIYEAPCVGTVAETFEAESRKQAENIAWERSVEHREYIIGGYDLYLITYDRLTRQYELVPVCDMDEVDE